MASGADLLRLEADAHAIDAPLGRFQHFEA
jgi:hypothetical protein